MDNETRDLYSLPTTYVYVARQPIFQQDRRLHAYELIFQESKGSRLSEIGGDRGTTGLLTSTFITEGIEKISNHRQAYIKFTKNLLLKKVPETFPKAKIVIEIINDIPPDPDVINACKKLFDAGYTIALDDFSYDYKFEPLLKLAHIVKIDLQNTPPNKIERTLYNLGRHKVILLAQNVETQEGFIKACRLGFKFFQGYFFCKPELIKIKEISSTKINLLRLMAEVNRKTTTAERLEKIIILDIGMSYKLLRYVNSSYFYRLQKVESVRHAIAYVGSDGIKKFITLVLISELSTDKPKELVRLSLLRARCCQLLAENSVKKFSSTQAFLLGLFSLIDAILDASMGKVLAGLPLEEEIKNALLYQTGSLVPLLQAITLNEQNKSKECQEVLATLGIDLIKFSEIYMQSVHFTDSLLFK